MTATERYIRRCITRYGYADRPWGNRAAGRMARAWDRVVPRLIASGALDTVTVSPTGIVLTVRATGRS